MSHNEKGQQNVNNCILRKKTYQQISRSIQYIPRVKLHKTLLIGQTHYPWRSSHTLSKKVAKDHISAYFCIPQCYLYTIALL